MVGFHVDSLLTWIMSFHKGGRKHLDGYTRIEHPLMRWRWDLYIFSLTAGDFLAMMCSKTGGLRSPMLGGKLMGQHALLYSN
jgi:hypothetical protein